MITVPNRYFSVHTHSRYSAKDALPDVRLMVETAHRLGYRALGLTDHGTVSGTVQLYKACKKVGVEPLPGIELYVTPERLHKVQGSQHLTVVANSEEGYRNLVRLNNLAVANHFYRPRVDLADLASFSEAGYTQGLILGTGCWFGVVQRAIENNGERAGRRLVAALASWFPQTYVELHNHGVERDDDGMSEDEMVEALVRIADDLGLPYFIASDAHYLSPSDQPLHDALKRMMSFSDDPDEAVFPGGPYCLLTDADLYRNFEPKVVERSLDHMDYMLTTAKVRIPELDAFSLKVPDVSRIGDPFNEIAAEVLSAVDSMPKRYKERALDELDVVRASGMAGYLLLVKQVCDYMAEADIWFITRGSASGSLVCWLLGITQVDPVAWGLRMDRFMSADRTRPPDIDLDVEHERREQVVRWLEDRFSTRQVGSHMQMGLDSEEEVGKGSLLVSYVSAQRKMGRPGLTWERLPSADRKWLEVMSTLKLISGNGTHAAGYIVAPSEASVAQLPMSKIASRNAEVTSYGKKDVEALGFCKLDLLGLRTRTAVRVACTLIAGRNPEKFTAPADVYSDITYRDTAVFSRIGAGKTAGMFQLEGKSFTRGCRDMKPKNLGDLVAAQALFRPAMTSTRLDKLYLARRRGEEKVPVQHPDIMEVTKKTYGIALYQEQIMALCRVIGMDADELTDTLDAVKASNAATEDARIFLATIAARVRDLAVARGWGDADVDWLVDGLAGYADYSFNKAHAASYGTEAYNTAWLMVHYPLEYWTGLLYASSGSDKEKLYLAAARSDGVRIVPAHVNRSSVSYTVDPKIDVIRRGLLAIPGIGTVAATELVEKAPFTSLQDLGTRVVHRKVPGAKNLLLGLPPQECGGAVGVLHEYEAFDDIPTH